MEKTNLKFLNRILKDQKFLIALSKYSNNDINILLQNISKITEYYLSEPSAKCTTNIEELFSLIKTSSKNKFNIVVFNGEKERSLKLLGFNPNDYYEEADLMALDKTLSYISHHEYLKVFNSIEESLSVGLSLPNVLYGQILKQPKGKEQDLVVGETEKEYFTRVMQQRLADTNKKNDKKIVRLIRKVFEHYLDRGIILCFINSQKADRKFKPTEITLVNLPSKLELLSICALGKGLKQGEKKSIQEKTTEPEPKKYSSLQYSRIELVPIDDTFVYTNEELTGDINYDIDTVFGKLDVKGTREKISTNPDANVSSIKKSSDINLTRRNGRYLINHGRHRLLYVLAYFHRSKDSYNTDEKLAGFRKYLSIPANVNVTIEDEEFQSILISLERIRPNIKFLKVDIRNDLKEILIIDGENVYHTTNNKDVLELSKYILENKVNNKFYIGKTNPTKNDYRMLSNHLLVNLKEKFFEMNFLDIIRYIKENNIVIDNQKYDGTELDYSSLYAVYTSIINRYTLDIIQYNESTMIKEAESTVIASKLETVLTKIFTDNPKLLLLDSTAIVNYLKSKEEFKKYPELYLKRSVENNRYRNKKIYEMLQSTYPEESEKHKR